MAYLPVAGVLEGGCRQHGVRAPEVSRVPENVTIEREALAVAGVLIQDVFEHLQRFFNPVLPTSPSCPFRPFHPHLDITPTSPTAPALPAPPTIPVITYCSISATSVICCRAGGAHTLPHEAGQRYGRLRVPGGGRCCLAQQLLRLLDAVLGGGFRV